MAHLGVDVAAFVDGQLSVQSMDAARLHLETCAECEKAVRQQEALKSRMSTVSAPKLSPAFLASLSDVPRACHVTESLWDRVRHSKPARFGVALVGASLTVAVVAYAMGGAREQVGDAVTPTAERYAAGFFEAPAPATTVQASSALTPDDMNELDDAGWPCHDTLARDMHRTGADWLDNGSTIALTYANGIHRLQLFEQNGSLDTEGLQGFEKRRISNADVWVREGMPRVVTWDHDGVVYTVVTDAGNRHIADVVKELPTPAPDSGTVGRIGDGLDRMTTWIAPAA